MIPVRGAKLPQPGAITSFMFDRGERTDGSGERHFHRGIDFAARQGAPVYAAAGGRVTHASAQWRSGFSGYGRHVVIEHRDGTHALYAHLATVHVQPGEFVSEGDAIGTVGNSRFTREDPTLERGGYHLHFEIAERAYPMPPEADRLDPEAWLQGRTPEGNRAADGPFSRSCSPLVCPGCGCGLVVIRDDRRGPETKGSPDAPQPEST